MGHVDEGNFQFLLVAADLNFHFGAQFAVEVGQRFIEQKQGRAGNQSARQGHALLLAAG
jgi:hypothetical protein